MYEYYIIVANTVKRDGGYTVGQQVPTFILSARIQGINSEEQAVSVATRLLKLNDPELEVHVFAKGIRAAGEMWQAEEAVAATEYLVAASC